MRNPERLHDLEPLSHFGARELNLLSEAVTEMEVPQGTLIFKEDDAAGDLYLVENGDVRLRKMTAFGEYELLRPGPEDLIGEDSFLTGVARDTDALTATDVNLLVFDARALASASEQDSRFELALHWALWRGLSKKLRLANDRLTAIFSTDTAPASAPMAVDRESSSETHLGMASKVGLFREQRLSAMEINFLASLSREEIFAPGKTIFKEGETGDKMFIVADGTVMISKSIAGVGEEALAFLERGEYFGEMALIDQRPRSADARAHPEKGVTVLALPRAVVEGLLNIEKVSSVRLLKILTSLAAQRTRAIQDKLVGWFLLAGGDIDPTPPSGGA